MAATVPTGFDPAPKHLGTVLSFTAGGTILDGQIVGFAATGTSETVVPSTTSTGSPVGVALYGATAGQKVAVAGNGSVVKVELSADDATADAGDFLGLSAVAGCAAVQDGAIAAHNSEAAGQFPIGQVIEDIAAGASTVGGRGYVLINITPIWTASS